LAAGALYRECNNNVGAANKFRARTSEKHFRNAGEIREKCKRDDIRSTDYKPGNARPFRDAKQKKERQRQKMM